jgi:hypothetical protein
MFKKKKIIVHCFSSSGCFFSRSNSFSRRLLTAFPAADASFPEATPFPEDYCFSSSGCFFSRSNSFSKKITTLSAADTLLG